MKMGKTISVETGITKVETEFKGFSVSVFIPAKQLVDKDWRAIELVIDNHFAQAKASLTTLMIGTMLKGADYDVFKEGNG